MPNLAPITITSNTLVTAFNPTRTRSDNSVAELRSSLDANNVSLRVTSRDQANGAHRAIVKIDIPVTGLVDGVLTVLDREIIEINVRRSVYASPAHRALVSDLTSKVLAAQLVKDVVEKSEGFW